jgi:hypothetical protein
MTNLGAANEYNIGGYYAWGETTAKTYFIWNNYKWGRYGKVTKYNASDGKTILDDSDDAATAVDSRWSIPTEAQWQELTDNCEYEWVMTPVEGARFTSKINGESIFLPGAGSKFDDDPVEEECMYWTKELSGDSNGALLFYSGDGFYGIGADIRCFGMPIRPVRKK